ncbi:MAG: DUF4358 domain-containing protein [Clostridia bacterium]|nr:DUF4358 domain-containing protein [Clostridia bacterium]
MKMKLIAAALLLTMMLSAVSCGGNPATTDTTDTAADTAAVTEVQPIDVPTLAQTLATSCAFSEELMSNDVYLKNHMYGFGVEDLVAYAAYVPVSITPEEVFVFETKTEDAAKALADKLGDYVAYQISQYSDYAAAQVPKLDKPVIVTKGCVVVYIISEDNAAAAEVVKGLIG